MESLPLNLARYTRDPEKFPLLRNYFFVKIEHFAGDDELEAIELIGPSAQKLSISHIIFNHTDNLRIIFESLKLLKVLILYRIQMNCDDDMKISDHQRTLEKLELDQVDHKVLKCFHNLQVLNLEIIDASNQRDSESMVTFLSSQKKLESMSIENISETEMVLFSNDDSNKFSFRLKNFSVLNMRVRNMETFEVNFIKFLKLHERSMRKFKIEGCLSQQIYKFVTKSFNVLEELQLNLEELPQETSFYDALKPNRSLKILKLNGPIKISNLNGFKGILSNYPNVQHISLADTDAFVANDVFHLMSKKLSKLNHLSVLNLHESFSGNTVFPSLKHFSIRILNNIDQWKTFISQNETIESLNVGWIKRDQFTTDIINEITDLRNLRHLKFGGRFIASKRIYDVIKEDYKKIRTLDLKVANYEEIKNLKFVFPLNKDLWLPQCTYFDEGHDREPVNDW